MSFRRPLENLDFFDGINADLPGDLSVEGDVFLNSLPSNSILTLNSTKQIRTAALDDGKILIGQTGNLPISANITGTTHGISITSGPGSIIIDTKQPIDTTSDVKFNTLNVTNGLTTSGDIMPDTANTRNLGSSLKPFANIYGTFLPAGDLNPSLDSTYSLGSTFKRWLNLKCRAAIIDNSLTLSNLTAGSLLCLNALNGVNSVVLASSSSNGNNSTLSYAGQILTLNASNTQDLSSGGNPSFVTVNGRTIATDGGNLDNLMTLLSGLTRAEVVQLLNIGLTAISSANWTYLSTMNQNVSTSSSPSFVTVNGRTIATDGGNLDNLVTLLSGLTRAEVVQLLNIGLTAISSANWTYLSTMDQNVSTTSDITHHNIICSNNLTLSAIPTNRILYSDSGTGFISALSALTNGQVYLGSTGAKPVGASITSTGGSITITSGAGTLNLETVGDIGSITNANGTNISLAGGVLTCTMTQDLGTTASPTFSAGVNCGVILSTSNIIAYSGTANQVFIGLINMTSPKPGITIGAFPNQTYIYQPSAGNIAWVCNAGSSASPTSDMTLSSSVLTVPALSTSGVITNTNTTDSSSTATGSVILSGGVAIAKTLFVGTGVHNAGVLTNTNTTDSSSISTGSAILSGGVGIAKKLFVGTSITQNGNSVIDVTYLPKRATLWHDDSLVTHGNAITKVINGTSCYYAMVCYQNTPATADAFTQSFTCQAGTYTLDILGHVATNNAIQQWSLDGVNIGAAIDWYSVGGFAATTKTMSLGAISAGYHVLKSTVTGKNASSTDFFIQLTKFSIYQAAD